MQRSQIPTTVIKMVNQRQRALASMNRLDERREKLISNIKYWWQGMQPTSITPTLVDRVKEQLMELTPPDTSKFYKGYINKLNNLKLD